MRGKLKKRILVFILSFIFLSSIISASEAFFLNPRSGHITLLAVQESGDAFRGSIAELYLDIKPGSGRVFMDTFPISKVDTQISTRFAKEIVCNYLDIDCSAYDFFYTIRSDSVIIGGPSAGAAIAAVTFATLENLEIEEDITVTGTINSGGIVGPVSGLRSKVDAASEAGLETVLIPSGMVLINDNNETLDIVDYGENRGVRVKEVYSLEDVVYEMTGEDYSEDNNFTIPAKYENTMRIVSEKICNRTDKLHQIMVDLTEFDLEGEDRELAYNLMDTAINLTAQAESAYDFNQYYSAASYCFGANIRYRNIVMLQKDLDNNTIAEFIQNVENHINEYEAFVENETLSTVADLETYIIIKERLVTARDYLDNAKSAFYDNKYDALYNLAYAIERLDSAKVWEFFFDVEGKEFTINEDVMKKSCIQKISEAQERYQYVKLFLPVGLDEARRDIDRSLLDYRDGDYDLCVSRASNAKATVNVILSVMGVPQDNLKGLLQQKLDSVEKIVVREQEKGVFPILGYSYYEYAKSLKDTDLYSSLIYAEQALELSTLEIYFEEDKAPLRLFITSFNIIPMFIFVLGVVLGVLLFSTLFMRIPKYRRKARRKKLRRRF